MENGTTAELSYEVLPMHMSANHCVLGNKCTHDVTYPETHVSRVVLCTAWGQYKRTVLTMGIGLLCSF